MKFYSKDIDSWVKWVNQGNSVVARLTKNIILAVVGVGIIVATSVATGAPVDFGNVVLGSAVIPVLSFIAGVFSSDEDTEA